MPTLPQVNITLQNGNLGGTTATADGTVGLVITAVTEGTVVAGTPFLVSNLAAIQALGITTANNPLLVKTLNEFATEAISQGINQWQLYVLPVAAAMKIPQMADVTNTGGAKKLLDFAAGTVRVLALIGDDSKIYPGGSGLTTNHSINDDCYTAIANAQVLATNYATAQKPLRVVVGCTNYVGVANASGLLDQTQGVPPAYNRVMAFLGDTVTGGGCAIGVPLARFAALPVQRKISRVRSGAIASTTAFVGTIPADVYPDTATMIGKGFVTFHTFPNKAGFFITGDNTCTADSDDYAMMCRGRVIDKAQILAYNTFVNEVDDEVAVTSTGTIDPGYAAWLEAQIENQINQTMTVNGEISGVACNIDTNQNILATNRLNVVLKVTPVGYATDIEVQLGFDNPAN